uniref:Regulatory protein E2 n=1 Tax=Human papillomavirus TaxID=10566 RepID=A0A385PJH1_9PAPI|nr:MAG: E2 protein [Human papillomavirus]
METQQTLAARFAAQQDKQMTLIEQESTNINDHIEYWDSVRLEYLLAYYARKEGHTKLGLQPLPVLAVSEYRAKEAIQMKLLLTSLAKSIYGAELWTLSEASAELINTSPKHCFKKNPFTVTVYFDNDEKNAYPYVCWDFIYYQDEESKWHKVSGQVDSNGLYFTEITGDTVYFTLFSPDAERYGHTGKWTVNFKNETIFASVTSSTRSASEPEARTPTNTDSQPKTPRKRKQTDSDSDSDSPTSTSRGFRLRRRRREGKQSPRRTTNRRGRELGSAPSPDQVGSRSRTVPRTGLTGLRRLQEEAWDPFLIVFQGCPNILKCFRNRFTVRFPNLFVTASSVFHWIVENDADKIASARMLIAFNNENQRNMFLNAITVPKGTRYWFGNIDKL